MIATPKIISEACAGDAPPRRRTLHDISADLLAIEDMLVELDGDVSDEVGLIVDEWLADINKDLEGKTDGYAALITEIEKRSIARKQESDRMAALAKRDEKHADWLKLKLKATLDFHNIKKVDCRRFRVTVCNNGGKIPLIVDEATVPKEYKTQVIETVIDNDSIRNDLEAGTKLDFAKFGERGTHLRIK